MVHHKKLFPFDYNNDSEVAAKLNHFHTENVIKRK